jgi:hypothetical protein
MRPSSPRTATCRTPASIMLVARTRSLTSGRSSRPEALAACMRVSEASRGGSCRRPSLTPAGCGELDARLRPDHTFRATRPGCWTHLGSRLKDPWQRARSLCPQHPARRHWRWGTSLRVDWREGPLRTSPMGVLAVAALFNSDARKRPNVSAENTELTRKLEEQVLNEGNLDVIDEILSPGFVAHVGGAPSALQGPAASPGARSGPGTHQGRSRVCQRPARPAKSWRSRSTGSPTGSLPKSAPFLIW